MLCITQLQQVPILLLQAKFFMCKLQWPRWLLADCWFKHVHSDDRLIDDQWLDISITHQ